MDSARSKYIDEGQRVCVMNELADSLQQAQRALAAGDFAGFERCTEQQMDLCRKLQGFERTRSVDRGATKPRADSLVSESRAIEIRLRRLTQKHAALLRRSTRSLQIFSNLLQSAGAVYEARVQPAGGCADTPCQT